MPNPSQKQYVQFHKAMQVHQSKVNEKFREKYLDCVALTMKKGQTTGKQKSLQELCKMFTLAKASTNDDIGVLLKSGFFARSHGAVGGGGWAQA